MLLVLFILIRVKSEPNVKQSEAVQSGNAPASTNQD